MTSTFKKSDNVIWDKVYAAVTESAPPLCPVPFLQHRGFTTRAAEDQPALET